MKKTNALPADKSERLVKVWDAPTRVFHWSVVLLVAALWFTANQGFMKAHMFCGLSLLTLLVFRLVWGMIGSTTARFSNFLHAPAQVIGYFKALMREEKPVYAGHNPAGGLMVMTMILILCAQAATGLFANDGVKFHGPLALKISSNASDRLTELHMWLFNGILFLIWMHLVAIFFYLCVKNENLIGPMVTGFKRREHAPPGLQLEFVSGFIALAVVATVASLAAFVLL